MNNKFIFYSYWFLTLIFFMKFIVILSFLNHLNTTSFLLQVSKYDNNDKTYK